MMPYIWKHPFGLEWPSIHSYGAMAVVALLMAVWLVTREARRVKLDPDRMFNVVILLFVVGLVGARVLYIVVNWDSYRDASAASAFKLWEGGLVWYGGILFALPFGLWWFRRTKLPVWESADLLFLGTIFALAFARWGCLLAGCCYGDECDLPWAVSYTDQDSIAIKEIYPPPMYTYGERPPTPHLHPAPIYASLMAFAITGLLVLLQHVKRFPGQVLAVGLCLYAVGRFFLETIRGDDEARGAVEFGDGLSLSTSQLIGIAMFIAGLGLYLLLAKRQRAQSSPTT